jgi:hypothetical protein
MKERESRWGRRKYATKMVEFWYRASPQTLYQAVKLPQQRVMLSEINADLSLQFHSLLLVSFLL